MFHCRGRGAGEPRRSDGRCGRCGFLRGWFRGGIVRCLPCIMISLESGRERREREDGEPLHSVD